MTPIRVLSCPSIKATMAELAGPCGSHPGKVHKQPLHKSLASRDSWITVLILKSLTDTESERSVTH